MYSHTAELPVITGAPRRARRPFTSVVSPLAAALLLGSAFCSAMAWRAATSASQVVADASPALVVASLHDRPSHNGRYRAEVTSVSPFAVGTAQQWTVRLERRDHRRVNGAHVSARAWMPDDPTQPGIPATVSALGGGRYRLDGIRFTRPGWWNVALVVAGARGTDSVAFNVVLR
jgi:hypothetical protein